MKRDLSTVLTDLKANRGPQLLLIFGEDWQVAESCRALIDRLVPPEHRSFNCERFDGRAASWDQIEASIRTPPFFPGKKLVWVESAPYFYARDQKGQLGGKVLDLWRDGRGEDAAKLLIDLLVLEGWTQERWDALDDPSATSFLDLLGTGSSEERIDARALWAYCKNLPWDLAKRKAAGTQRLDSLLDDGVPPWSFLLLTAVEVDRRTRLYKRLEELGAVLYVGLDRERSGKITRDTLLEFVTRRLRETGKTLEPPAREMLLSRAGDDLRGFHQELEKLLLFVGNRSMVRAEDVRAVFRDRAEGWIFELTRALGDRDAHAALIQLARLINQGEHPLKILSAVAAEARRLLVARQLLTGQLAKVWRRGMSYSQYQQIVAPHGLALPGRGHPYGDYLCLQRAERFSLPELKSLMESLADSDLRLKSSGSQPRLVLERVFLKLCITPRGGVHHHRRVGV